MVEWVSRKVDQPTAEDIAAVTTAAEQRLDAGRPKRQSRKCQTTRKKQV